MVMVLIVGDVVWMFVVDVNVGVGGVFCLLDKGLLLIGVVVEGVFNIVGWIYVEVDLV